MVWRSKVELKMFPGPGEVEPFERGVEDHVGSAESVDEEIYGRVRETDETRRAVDTMLAEESRKKAVRSEDDTGASKMRRKRMESHLGRCPKIPPSKPSKPSTDVVWPMTAASQMTKTDGVSEGMDIRREAEHE